jgi:hypothetical protein
MMLSTASVAAVDLHQNSSAVLGARIAVSCGHRLAVSSQPMMRDVPVH